EEVIMTVNIKLDEIDMNVKRNSKESKYVELLYTIEGESTPLVGEGKLSIPKEDMFNYINDIENIIKGEIIEAIEGDSINIKSNNPIHKGEMIEKQGIVYSVVGEGVRITGQVELNEVQRDDTKLKQKIRETIIDSF